MKRSEMIKLIDGFLKDINTPSTDQLLDFIEDIGMLPPAARFNDPGHFPGDDFPYLSNEWEPEE